MLHATRETHVRSYSSQISGPLPFRHSLLTGRPVEVPLFHGGKARPGPSPTRLDVMRRQYVKVGPSPSSALIQRFPHTLQRRQISTSQQLRPFFFFLFFSMAIAISALSQGSLPPVPMTIILIIG
ncbi:hypothetical protein CC80DRAFT_105807 [Byssothecium circinans]|uniref:Uncharacterized protein n=1 Tax=Byssothecium circinans TaxID=147558 RepID=A0A6A5UJM0_9PLEO|nr:hypothetical protein CC80DRAFT_105807 [Byssothecium circinans]